MAYAYDKELLNMFKAKARATVRANTHRGYIGCRDCDAICSEFERDLDECDSIRKGADRMTALRAVLFYITECVKLASCADSSSGYLTGIIEYAFEILEKCTCDIAENDESVGKDALALILKESQHKAYDGWAEFRYELAESGVKLCDKKLEMKFTDVLDAWLESAKTREFSGHDLIKDKLIRYKLKRHLYGRESVEDILRDNISNMYFRRIAVCDAAADGDFEKAERLCMEAADSRWYSENDPDDWNNILLSVYEKSGDEDKIICQLEKLLFFGNLSCWERLRKIYEARGTWNEEYQLLLGACESNCNVSTYMKILDREKEWERLLDEVEKHPKEVFTYGKHLKKVDTERISIIGCAYAKGEFDKAKTRREYAKACRLVLKVIRWGGGEQAERLTAEVKEKYSNRPALLEELECLEREL